MDRIEVLKCGSVIQHGKFNDRIYLMKAGKGLTDNLPLQLVNMAKDRGYSKIFVKVPEGVSTPFIRSGFNVEAAIPGFYKGKEKGLFAAYYPDNRRNVEKDKSLYDSNRELAIKKRDNNLTVPDMDSFSICRCNEKDIFKMSEIYSKVFPSYPFPIDKPEYLLETMKDNVNYYSMKKNDLILALSSAEIDRKSENAEMTDFATLPEWRGKGFGQALLKFMEDEMIEEGIKVVYTIARAASAGMNITFARLGYSYCGRLINNTNISGKIESMNIWYKNL